MDFGRGRCSKPTAAALLVVVVEFLLVVVDFLPVVIFVVVDATAAGVGVVAAVYVVHDLGALGGGHGGGAHRAHVRLGLRVRFDLATSRLQLREKRGVGVGAGARSAAAWSRLLARPFLVRSHRQLWH